MHKRFFKALPIVSVMLLLAVQNGIGGPVTSTLQGDRSHIIKEVRHELAMLPYYGVFDWLQFEVNTDNSIVLSGQVVRPTTKSDAESRVKDIAGVSLVRNEIQVLPLSPGDDRLRRALYRRIYNENSPLFRYATQSVPSIHIIVENGHVVLRGVVDSDMDAKLAYIRASGVGGVFSVKNELQLEGGRTAR